MVFDEKLVHIAMETACGKPPKDMGIITLGDGYEASENIAAHHDRVACIEKICESKKATTSILCVVAASKAPEKAAEKSDEKLDYKKDDEKKSDTTAGAQKIIGFSLVVLILGVLNY
ncbi:AMP-binding_C domain-containing protein [Caenorhabditis elegans]|uniref:AMP-binding_C domain-containing protein n=1 Tax=Caenorhabditis elegans TaxID=6239 RepID=O16579_CAEEL|nr:AMP-binding_C domain-containing protein [Caenorhabditis elegans]CCD66452.1 AMP-binding_C domain-containing protein [Caenorhabditis elegans]|eukprot:NP_494206.2 Uncharacterized protein CELE_C33C12.7 [Caenorhabditis elegans]